MMYAVDPLLQRVEALPRTGEYSVVLVMADGQERTVLIRVDAGEVLAPAANLGDWAPTSTTYQAMTAAVRAMHDAREAAGRQRILLQDVEGGWDVTLGNVVLGASGQPACIAHGDLESSGATLFTCATCGAQGRYG
jgi:hypothetical protein